MNAVVVYSGGKDSHPALMQAIKNRQNIVGVFYVDVGKNHFNLFPDTGKTDLIKTLIKIMGFKLYTYKVPDLGLPNFLRPGPDGKIVKLFAIKIFKHIKNKIKNAEIIYAGLTEVFEEDKMSLDFQIELCKKNNLEYNFPLLKKSFLEVLKKAIDSKLKVLIVGVSGQESLKYLGKIIDKQFIRHVKTLRGEKAGGWDSSNDFQTLVLESPITNSRIKILKSQVVKIPNGGWYLEILDWKMEKK